MSKRFKNSKFRQAFVAANARRGIAYQLRAMRGKRTQEEIGVMVGKPQNVISRLEDPRYGKATIQTLLDFAAAYDVGLLVKFVSYGKVQAEAENLTHESLVPLNYSAEEKMREALTRESLLHGTPTILINQPPAPPMPPIPLTENETFSVDARIGGYGPSFAIGGHG
jgi:hypothetical protein